MLDLWCIPQSASASDGGLRLPSEYEWAGVASTATSSLQVGPDSLGLADNLKHHPLNYVGTY